jgi:hypothetical protein
MNQIVRGGKRQGAGRPRGSKGKKTLEKEEARRLLREMVMASIAPLVDAQIANALGVKFLVARNKRTGKFEKLTEAEAAVKMSRESEYESIEVWEERPSVQAFTDLMNRTIDKPVEQTAIEHSGGQRVVYSWKK